MHDWLISKKRYWGLALPIFECECGNFEVIGSKEELKKRAVEGWDSFNENSPHRPWVDNVKIRCKKCKKTVSRIKDVGNPWLDAGIVPFSTIKYFEDKNYWKKWFPLELVCESFPGQFKNWFYSLLVMSAVLENSAPMKTIFGFASVKDERGEDMHKSKGNAIWLDEAAEKVGADPMRWLYLRQNPADNLLFGYKTVEEIKRKLLTLLNVYTFLNTYVDKKDFPKTDIAKPKNILDKWILSKIDHLIVTSKFNLDKYDAAKTVLAIEDFFINDLSLWYVRRSRKRFHETSSDRNEAIAVLYYVLLNLTKMVAPIMPFFAEEMYLNLRNSEMSESVHLCEWPEIKGEGHTDLELEEKMDEVRTIVNSALAERSAKAIKIRQPLASLKIRSAKSEILNYEELLELIKEEVNVKEIIFDAKIENKVELDTNITEKLKEEGTVRDIIRQVQEKRKEMGLVPQDKISVQFLVPKKEKLIIEKNRSLLLKEFRATEIFTEERDGGIEIKIKKV